MGGENMHSTHRSKTENKVRELIKEGILEQLAMQRRLCLLVSKNLYFLQVLKVSNSVSFVSSASLHGLAVKTPNKQCSMGI